MGIYSISLTFCCVFAVLAQHVKDQNELGALQLSLSTVKDSKKRLFLALAVCSMLPLFVLSAFRFNVGTDYDYTYRPMFEEVVGGASMGQVGEEPGQWLLAKIVAVLGGGHVWFFALTSLIIAVFMTLGIYQQSPLFWVSIVLYVVGQGYFVGMNGVAQYMGMAIVFYAFKYVEKPCFWKYAICVVIGTLIHFSTIVFLPLYFLGKIKFKIGPWVGMGAVLLLSVFNGTVKALAEWAIGLTKYGIYIGTDFQRTERFYPTHFMVHLLIVAIATVYFFKNENHTKPLYRFLYYLELIALFLMMNRNIMPIADRLCWTLEIGLLLLVPHIAVSEKNKTIRTVLLILILGTWASITIVEAIYNRAHEVLPYRFVFWPGWAIA